MLLGEKIKQAIDTKGLTPDEVAVHAGMVVSNMYKIFKRDSVESKYLEKIAEKLELPVGYFFESFAEDQATYTTKQNGNVNAGRDIKAKKIIPEAKLEANNPIYDNNIEELLYKNKLCESEKAGLLEQMRLKDELLAAKDEIIGQLKKSLAHS